MEVPLPQEVAAAALPAGSLATPDAGDAHGARGAVRGAAGGAQPPNGTYDCRDGGCGARGVCTQRGTCICDFWHFGRSCGESFAAAYPAQYWAWFAWVGAAHLALALVVGSNLLLRRCTPLTAEHTHVRDAASAVVFLASVVRLVWLADPFRFDAVAGYSVVGSILMRVPQVLYVAGFFFVVLLWDGVRSAVAPDARRTRLLRIASVLVQLFVAGVSVSGSVLYGLNVTSQSADDRTLAKVAAAVANLVFAAISIVLFPVAMHYARNVYALLKRVEYMTSLTQQATFKAAMRGTLITLIWLTVNDVVLVTAVTLQAVFNWNLHSNFDAYFTFISVVHGFVEPSFGAAIGYCSYQTVRARHVRLRWLRCLGRKSAQSLAKVTAASGLPAVSDFSANSQKADDHAGQWTDGDFPETLRLRADPSMDSLEYIAYSPSVPAQRGQLATADSFSTEESRRSLLTGEL